ncbi:hypothetical protein NHX12_028967, partial [Muraenolepis orangiensis]
MQPSLCSLQTGPCGPTPSPGDQSEEKELFEKFWRGTFQAVAKPRPGSVIVASITSRRRVALLKDEGGEDNGVEDDEEDGNVEDDDDEDDPLTQWSPSASWLHSILHSPPLIFSHGIRPTTGSRDHKEYGAVLSRAHPLTQVAQGTPPG